MGGHPAPVFEFDIGEETLVAIEDPAVDERGKFHERWPGAFKMAAFIAGLGKR